MDEVIVRVTNAITRILETSQSQRPLSGHRKTALVNICILLNQLLELDSLTNKRIRLFCRQLKRLMDNNDSLSNNFWIKLRDDILYASDKSKDGSSMDSNWNHFLKRMNFEEKLEERELQFQQIIGQRKSFSELFYKHNEFFNGYLQRCISLHSKMRMQDLVENLDDLLFRVYGLKDFSLSLNSRKHLQKKLKCIEIPIDSSNRFLQSLNSIFYRLDNSFNEMNNNISTFLPSEQKNMRLSGIPVMIEEVLEQNRWLVILGDPGSAKTTLLRWITHVFAEAACRSEGKVDLKGDYSLPVRIPILIRIGEFASWLDQHQTKTLMDYIGEHTWFSERYCQDEGAIVLKELIYHGHALILLDGLDEIPEIERRGEIVDLVKKFIDEYLQAPDFISAFDDRMFEPIMLIKYGEVLETQPPNKFGGNQIVITSRIIGYEFYPLNGPFIRHHLLVLLNQKETNEFVNKWMKQVDKSIRHILLNEEIQLEGETVKALSKIRYYPEGTLFENGLEPIKSNPCLLSLICTFIFQSSIVFHPKSRIEVYSHAIQAAVRSWTKQNPPILEGDLIDFLINLAIYLHLQSPSGLIDAFDMKRLCCLTLKQQGISNNRIELQKYAEKTISLLESSVAIVAERGLQIFGFLHLSFQEYFVAQSFVRGSSIEDIAKSILSLTIYPRLRESLLLAVGWISWKWPVDKYDKFCNLLFTPPENQSIPFGILLFFDAINDIHRLPSKSIIFIALNNLLNHPHNEIIETYLIPNLSKLPEDIIIDWMESSLKEERFLLKFCQSFPTDSEKLYESTKNDRNPISSIIYQQLWSFHKRSSSIEFLIDQTLRTTLMSVVIPDQIFNKDFALYFLSHDICPSNIHPLLLSVIIALCGGMWLNHEGSTSKVEFSLKKMHRQSSILISILEYFDNKEESHLTKLHKLIKQYESALQHTLPTNTSVDIIDTFIALICLQGLSQPLIYQKYDGYQALPLALERFKQIWFYLKELCQPSRLDFLQLTDTYIDRMTIESIMKMLLSQPNQFKQQRMSFSLVYRTAWKKLGVRDLENSCRFNICRRNKVGRYVQCHPHFSHFIGERKLDELAANIHSLEKLQQEPFFLLTFLPQPLQPLYYYTTISPTNKTDSLPLVVFLSLCLTHFKDIDKEKSTSFLALPMWQTLFRKHMLENYALVHFQEEYSNNEFTDADANTFLNVMKDPHLFESFLINQSEQWEILLSVERQRIFALKSEVQDQERDVRLFAASISLARLFQAKYRSRKYQKIKEISLSTVENNEVYFAIINILDPILRIIALSIILDMKDPLIFDIEQRNHLRWKMISLLQSLLPRLSLLTLTLLFIRCYTTRQIFPEPFQYMASVIINKFNDTSVDRHCHETEAVFIALQQLNHSDLSRYLLGLAKRKENLSDLLLFNSTAFYQYFMNTTSFYSLNPFLLSSMYLVELTFDAQILNMYTITTQKIKISPLTILKQMWNDSSKDEKIMTFQVALWITNYLHTSSNKEERHDIIQGVSHCVIIDRKALQVIERWRDYRMNEDLKFFAHYAALQLVLEGSNIPCLIDIIEEMFLVDREFRLKSVVERLFISRSASLTMLNQIIVILHRNDRYSSKISVWIDRKEILELILNLELERIIADVRQPPEISRKSFLLMISDCSENLHIYLAEQLHEFVNTHSEVENTIKEEYVAIIIKWIIESSITVKTRENFSTKLYNYIFLLLHDQQFPRLQKAIVNALNSIFFLENIRKENVFMKNDTVINLERVICLWYTYTEDVVAVCLLAYGNCLLTLQRFHISRNVSDEMKNVITNLSETISSEIISIRATICLIFTESWNVKPNKMSNFLKNKSSMTSQERYKLLVQLSLYQQTNMASSRTEHNRKVVELIETHFLELIDMFVTDLYNCLLNKNSNNYLADPIPNYTEIALLLSRKKSIEFSDAVRNSFFGENEFKRKLCLYCKRNLKDQRTVMNLYTIFNIVTVEFLDMLDWIVDDDVSLTDIYGHYLKQVSDRDVIDKLFQLIDLTKLENQLSSLLHILRSLALVGAVSWLEVHQRLSIIMNIHCENDLRRLNNKRIIFLWLSKFTCFELVWPSYEKLSIESDIEEEFGREI